MNPRGNLEQASLSSPGNTSAAIRRVHELRTETSPPSDAEKSKDDSIVYNETPNKKFGAKLKSQRRGHSFNLKNNGPANTWQPPDGEPTVPPTAKRKWSFKRLAFGSKRSSSHDVSKDSPGAPQLINYGVTSSPASGSASVQRSQTLPPNMNPQSLAMYRGSTGGPPSLLSDPPMPPPPQWQTTPTSPSAMTSQSTSNLDYSHPHNGCNDNESSQKENKHPKEYRSVFEYKMAQINKSYSSTGLHSPSTDNFSTPTQTQDSNRKPWRSNHNYENISSLDTSRPAFHSSNTVAQVSSNRNNDRVNNNPSSHSNIHSHSFHSQDDAHLGGFSVPSSSSGLRYSHSMSHVGDNKQAVAMEAATESPQSKISSNRTNSWTESNSSGPTSTEKARKVAFSSRFNAHMDDKLKTKDTKRHLQEMRLRSSPKDSPTRQPMLATKDGLGDMGKVFKFDESSTKAYMRSSSEEADTMKTLKDTATSPPLPKTPPPTLTTPKRIHTTPKLSSNKSPKDSSIIDDHKWDVVQTPSAGYMYIVRQKPCYNTSTQTETLESDPLSPTQASMNTSSVVTKEERGIQARPGSIVAATLSPMQFTSPNMHSIGIGPDTNNVMDTSDSKSVTSPLKRHTSSASSDASSNARSPTQPKYWIPDEDMAKINDNPDQSDMLRKLSQEYFGRRRYSGSNKNLHQMISSSVEEKKQRRKSADMDSKMSPEMTLLHSDHETQMFNAEVVRGSNIGTKLGHFDSRQIDTNDNGRSRDKSHKSEDTHGNSNSTSHRLNTSSSSHQGYSYDSQFKTHNVKSTDASEIRDKNHAGSLNTREIAERARMDYVESGAFQKHGGMPRLQRTVSEQIRPFQERNKAYSKQTSRESTHSEMDTFSHAYQVSDPATITDSTMQPVPMRQRRLASDSESITPRGGKEFDARGRRLSSARSSSSGSGHSREEERQKSEMELKRLQQQALLNFYENKTGKRMSSSSMDSSFCNEHIVPQTKTTIRSDEQTINNVSKKNATHDLPSRRSSSGCSGYDSLKSNSTRDPIEMSPPPVLEMHHSTAASRDRGYHSHTSSGATTASSMSPRGDPYSPPLHPWSSASDMGKVTEEAESPDTVKLEREDSSEDDVTELKRKYKATVELEGQSKSVQYSSSSNESTTPGPIGPDNNRFTYNLGPNMNRQADEVDENDMSPPVLPPRNYRNFGSSATSRQVPQPQEPSPRDRQSSGTTGNQLDSQRSSSSSFQDVFTTDYDQTPERDSYADQLRQQSRRISQSQPTFLSSVRGYQKTTEMKTNVNLAMSRPVEKGSVKQEAHALQSLPSPNRSGASSDSHEPSSMRTNSANSTTWDNDSNRFSGGYSHNEQVSSSVNHSRRSESSLHHHHSPQQSFQSDVTRVSHHSPQTSFSELRAAQNAARMSPHHSPQQSISSVHSHSSGSSHGSNRSRHSPQDSFASDYSNRPGSDYSNRVNTSGAYHSPQPSFSSDINRTSHPHQSPQSNYARDVSDNKGQNYSRDMGDKRTRKHKHHHNKHSPQGSYSRDSTSSDSSYHRQYESSKRDSLGSQPVTPQSHSHIGRDSDSTPTSRPKATKDYLQSEIDNLPPPPPPPHQRYSPNTSLTEESKPLPPVPTDAELSDNRLSGDSYLQNKSNYRQGFDANYHRNGEVSPPGTLSQQPTPSRNTPKELNTPTSSINSNNTSLDNSMIQLSKMAPLGKQTESLDSVRTPPQTGSDRRPDAPSWKQNKVFTPVRPPMDMRLKSQNVDTSSTTPKAKNNTREDEETESPSVRDVVANFEKHGGEKKRKTKTVGKSKVQELRQNILSRSSDNLHESITSDGKRPRSGSNDYLLDSITPSRYERLCSSPIRDRKKRSASEENLVDYVPIAPEMPSPTHSVHNDNKLVSKSPNAIGESTRIASTSEETLRSSTPDRIQDVYGRYTDLDTTSGKNHVSDTKTKDVTNQSSDVKQMDIVTSSVHDHHDSPQHSSSRQRNHRHKHSDSSHSDSQSDIRSNDSGVLEDIAHVRSKTQEEIECDKQAALVASHLSEKDKELSNVLVPPPEHRTTTDYITSLFDTRGVNVNRKPSLLSKSGSKSETSSPSNKKRPTQLPNNNESPNKVDTGLPLPPTSPYWSPPSLAHLQNKMREDGVSADDILQDVNSNGNVDGQKETLINRIDKKLEILREEKQMLAEEIEENNSLGNEVTTVVEEKVTNPAEYKKYNLYVTELDKVICLLLNVSGRLARAENAVMSISADASKTEKKAVIAKRDELLEKLDDAKQLKEGIDKRSVQVATFLKKYLTTEEFEDYEHFIKMKSKLTVDQQDIEDKLKLGEEQLSALRKSLTQSTC